MATKDYSKLPISMLENILVEWAAREEETADTDSTQEWAAEGIEILKTLLRKNSNPHDQTRYYYMLADSYLKFGRTAKMIHGNYLTAFRYLQHAAKTNPNIGDSFYHLAFLAEKMTRGHEKWESAAFYAKEALERGLEKEKQIKIWCLLGKAYLELGFRDSAEKCFRTAKELDRDDAFARFRTQYSKKSTEKAVFARINPDGSRGNRRTEWIEKSRLGQCYVLEIDRRGTTLYGNGASMELNLREAELLKLFFEYSEGLTKYDIYNHLTTSIQKKSPDSIKTDIRRLRLALKKGIEVDEHALIQTVGERGNQRYRWNPDLEKHLIER